ncbi:hypothetical protein ACWF95_34105 [Streptomyces vinaceus]
MADVRPSPLSRATAALSSPALGAVLTISGLVVPVVGWVADRVDLRVLLVVQAALILILAAGHYWTRKNYIQVRRVTNLAAMDDVPYYDRVRSQLEAELISDYNEIADGHLRVYAAEVPRLSALLVKTVTDAQAQPQRILAADLTTNPQLLTSRREYISANRRFIDGGGRIDRVFIVHAADLARQDFADSLLKLVGQHRDLGVTCGLAVRDRLRADQAVDVVVFAQAAALVEEEQGDGDYNRGRSSVYFKGVARWADRFESVWGHGSDSAPRVLQAYESVARPLLDAGTWDDDRVTTTVASL